MNLLGKLFITCFAASSIFFRQCTSDDGPFDSWGLLDKYLRKVACIGDSIALGATKSSPPPTNQQFTAIYPTLLQSFLKEFYEIRVINLGVKDATIIEDSDEAYLLSQHYKTFTNYRFTSVIIQLGAYDTQSFYWNQEKFLFGFQNLIQYIILKGKPGIKIFICSPPPVYNTNQIHGINAATINMELPRILKDLAHGVNATFIDVHNELGGAELSKPFLFSSYNISVGKLNFQFTGDGFHPNGLGHLYIVKIILETMFGKQLCSYIFKDYLLRNRGVKYLLSEFATQANNVFMNQMLLGMTESVVLTASGSSRVAGARSDPSSFAEASPSSKLNDIKPFKSTTKRESKSFIKIHE